MIENVSTQLTVFHCFAHCLLPGRAFASLYALLFLEKEAEIGGRDYRRYALDTKRDGLIEGQKDGGTVRLLYAWKHKDISTNQER